VARRERASVKMMEDLSMANAIADAALERAKAEAIAGMAANGSKLYYDMFNSQAFGSTAGFDASQPVTGSARPENVSYYDRNGNLLSGRNYLRMLANLQYDPRVPVFVETNTSGATEFRYFLDFDRNRLFETNGIVPVIDENNRVSVVKGVTNVSRFVGDPEWIGVLERPDLPHSETNRFIGRMAYLVLPAGKTLDLNFIHNQVDRNSPDAIDIARAGNGFRRNQGVGSWEINLAAFFRELNPTNYAWGPTTYRYNNSPALPVGEAFDNARSILSFRYRNRNLLERAAFTLGQGNTENPRSPGDYFKADLIDNYGDGPLPRTGDPIFLPPPPALTSRDDDDPARPWPGSINTNAFTDIQQIFNVASGDFINRMQAPLRKNSSFDRYQFYRLAAQLGVDSTPAMKGKLHLNYENTAGKVTNTILAWTDPRIIPGERRRPAERFFSSAADLMLKASIDRVVTISNRNDVFYWGRQPGTYYMIGDTLVATNFSLTNIQVYAPFHTNFPSIQQSEYTPTIHRILQVAANIYDNMTNNLPSLTAAYPLHYPTVFRPVYTKTRTNVFISGWLEVTNVSQIYPGSSLDMAEVYRTNIVREGTNILLNPFGMHVIVGAKKGHPNFNEMALQTSVEVSRKLEVIKSSAGAPPIGTNQMFLVSLAQRWGMESWNPYTNKYARSVSMIGEANSTIAIKDGTNAFQPPLQMWNRRITSGVVQTNNWAGFTNLNVPNFAVVLSNNFNLLQDVGYTQAGGFRNTNTAQYSFLEPTPKFLLSTTNKVRYLMFDSSNGRVLDAVSFDNLETKMDIASQLYALPTASAGHVGGTNSGNNEDIYWDPTPVGRLTRGITNQLAAATGDLEVAPNIWRAFRFSDQGDKNGAISVWRKFVGLPLSATNRPVGPLSDLRRQIPFVPSRRIEQLVSWQVNDPFVHYMAQDLTRTRNSDLPKKRPILEPAGPAPWGIGLLNDRYRPWGGSPYEQATGPTGDILARNFAVKDAGIRRADDWEFPINESRTNYHFFANIGDLGRIHRGTPWQTLYLKSIYSIRSTPTGLREEPLIDPTTWLHWAGSAGTFPTFDWKLLDVFTTAPNENATRGLLSVNQTNRAAWSAVLSGVLVATNTLRNAESRAFGEHEGANPATAYKAAMVEPATQQVGLIVDSINFARERQLDVIPNPNLAANPTVPWVFNVKKNIFTGKTNAVFEHMGDVLSAPHLTVQSPYLNFYTNQIKSVLTDRALEYIPQQILSLLQRDEPRFVVYAFGQSLKSAAGSLTSDPNFYHMCTNYQITGEASMKMVFRVEGDLPDKRNPFTLNNPLRAVVESYQVLPPTE
ncbi:MAG TPA: hypothetical protein VK633_13170, partial [Verrucomicrobiae bacterium]|nr:hypothetical protein [Verrucomicrobiae bacterium]